MFIFVRTISIKNVNIDRSIFDLYRNSIGFEQLEQPISKILCKAMEYLKSNDFKKNYYSSLILR